MNPAARERGIDPSTEAWVEKGGPERYNHASTRAPPAVFTERAVSGILQLAHQGTRQ